VEQTDPPGSSTGQAAESDIYDYFVSIEPALPSKRRGFLVLQGCRLTHQGQQRSVGGYLRCLVNKLSSR